MVAVGQLLSEVFRGEADLPVAIRTYDGAQVGPSDAPATIVVRSPDALVRILHAPGQLGLARAYVAGDLDVEGDIFAALDLPRSIPDVQIGLRQWAHLAAVAGTRALRPLASPENENRRRRGRRHSKSRDRQAISHHYDLSNDFYQMVLGPSMTYSCAVWSDPSISLEEAQAAKHELVCSKLALGEGDRLLDVGCGWASMLRHAAIHHGVNATGVTLSTKQQEWAAKALADDGLSDQVTVRVQDYRDIDDGPYDAISSIGMSEHVGRERLSTYFASLHQLLRPGGRLLNHAISALPRRAARWPSPLPQFATGRGASGFGRRSFLDRYVFPDGELIEVGEIVSAMQAVGFEVRHVESLREHYGLTLRRWLSNLDANWDKATAAVGLGRARTWKLYMAASARSFETGKTGIHQVLAVKPADGVSGMPLRPNFQ